jgi:AcrR family transcriptional regulator
MGYGGKWRERERARELRAQAWTLQEIADELGVAKGSVSVWVRDVEFTPKPRNRGHPSGPKHPMRARKEAEIGQCRAEAEEFVAALDDEALNLFALGLYAGEGSKSSGCVSMANTNPLLLAVFAAWLRRAFDVDESRLRVRLYLHEGLDLVEATRFWSELLQVPASQFQKPYRAVADPSRRAAKHVHGCATLIYASSLLHRRVLALIEAVSCRFADPG